ncbi:MAG TPA: alpha/beta hydrolase [Bacteroidia bacterium]|jgi:putative phosphoribosyl transferase|nr:alpha/beta hydrolase [Bacteroidia bacterium]
MNTKNIFIPLGEVSLPAELSLPAKPKGLIIFSHGSGSSRLSPRNRYVASVLHKNNFATLLFDLLTEEEDSVYDNRFDIALLSQRLGGVTKWARNFPSTQDLITGYFGASTGSASALKAAAIPENKIAAVVSRGGRPDLAMEDAGKIRSAVLLIVGGFDTGVIELNGQFFEKLECVKRMEIVPGATHLFEEEGKLEEVAELAVKWYDQYLKR